MQIMKYKSLLLICGLLALFMCGCAESDSAKSESSVMAVSTPAPEISEVEAEAVVEEITDELVGAWEIGGLEIDHRIISLEDNAALKDLYDTDYLSIAGDGTFTLMSVPYTYSGVWKESWKEGYEHAYTLNCESYISMVGEDFLNGETTACDKQFRVYLDNDDTNTMFFADPEDDTILVYVRYEQESDFIEENRIELQGTVESVDEAEPEIAKEPEPNYEPATPATIGEENALQKANQYLRIMAFSYSGLIEQLEYEGYSHSEATYAADHCGADWNEQALEQAKDYLDSMAFSYSGLIEQLEYEGYTTAEATYAVDRCGADWNEQAARKAAEYLEIMSFSRSGLIDQLEFEGFTSSQAAYGAQQNGY